MESAGSETFNGRTLSPRSSRGHIHATTTADEDAGAQPAADPSVPSPALNIQPYWNPRHTRNDSYASMRGHGISLENHDDEDHEIGRACWAKQVTVNDYVVVSGPTGIGAYVVWNCTVDTLKGTKFIIRKRYSEFDVLRENLVSAFPHAAASIPELPRKSVISRFRPKFLEQRKAGLSHFLNCIILNPEFSSSPLVKDFVQI